jgi:hypothetical protein
LNLDKIFDYYHTVALMPIFLSSLILALFF